MVAPVNPSTARPSRWGRGGSLAVLILALVAAGAQEDAPLSDLLAPEPAAQPAELEEGPTLAELDILTESALLERERAVNEVIRAAYEQDAADLLRRLGPKQLREVQPRQVALAALTQNLSIVRGHISRDIAEAALQEAQALFDPVLRFSLNYRNEDSFDRVERVSRFRRGTVATTVGVGNVGAPFTDLVTGNFIFFGEGPVRFLGFDQPRPEGFVVSDEIASESPLTGADESVTFDFDVDQTLPWGVNILFNYQVRYQEAYWTINADTPREFGLQSFGSYHRPWVSSMTAAVAVPMPGSKNYGPDAAEADVTNRLAALADEQSTWRVRDVINATLLEVDLAYWELVKAANRLYVALENRNNVLELVEKTNRMYELREITEYHKAQVDAEMARVSGEVELAWNDYVRASNALHPLLDSRDDAVYLPLGYTRDLSTPLEAPARSVDRQDVADNPRVRAQRYDLDASEVVLTQRDLQRRPDVTLSASVSARQSNAVYGYGDFLDSTDSLFSPDTVTQNYALNFLRPWGNRAVHAAHAQAEAQALAQTLLLRGEQNAQARALADAQVGLTSARARTEITARNRELARFAYERAVDRQRGRTVTEFEIILKNNDLLEANRQWVDAVIEAKQAEARWLAAKGNLPQRYMERTAQTGMDRFRVRSLAENRLVPHFSGGGSSDE